MEAYNIKCATEYPSADVDVDHYNGNSKEQSTSSPTHFYRIIPLDITH
jgi:hypothetical protein